MTALVVYFLLAVLSSFVCSLSEAVLLSISHAHVALLIQSNRPSGRILARFKERIDHPLSAILTINTVANTMGATAVGAQTLQVFGNQAVALASGIMTLVILIFSEITPKTLGSVYCKQLAPLTAYVIQTLIWITYPLVIIFRAWSRMLSPDEPQAKVTREEVGIAADMGQEEGQIHDRERRIIHNLLELHKIPVRNVMTPRTVIFALPQTETVGEAVTNHSQLRYSRIPVFGKDLDDITGLVRRFQISQAVNQDREDQALSELASPMAVIPESASVAQALEEFITRREHIFLVVDEYGGTGGLITLEDAVETLLGVEIVDELDSVEDLQQHARLQGARLWHPDEEDD
jgi:CBS domain containing-hemolysin-like protein